MKKQIILAHENINTVQYGFPKSKLIPVIIEKDFNTKASYILKYKSEDLEICILKSESYHYILKIKKSDILKCKLALRAADELIYFDNQIMALYTCYTKAREAALKIIQTIEQCEIYSYMPGLDDINDAVIDLYTDNIKEIIQKYSLQKILL